jgi:hypothetical protein
VRNFVESAPAGLTASANRGLNREPSFWLRRARQPDNVKHLSLSVRTLPILCTCFYNASGLQSSCLIFVRSAFGQCKTRDIADAEWPASGNTPGTSHFRNRRCFEETPRTRIESAYSMQKMKWELREAVPRTQAGCVPPLPPRRSGDGETSRSGTGVGTPRASFEVRLRGIVPDSGRFLPSTWAAARRTNLDQPLAGSSTPFLSPTRQDQRHSAPALIAVQPGHTCGWSRNQKTFRRSVGVALPGTLPKSSPAPDRCIVRKEGIR